MVSSKNTPILMTDILKKKTSQGRKKIEIKKIEEINNRQVTFSKRRSGLFNKACELCILTGAELAIVVVSPGGRIYTLGHPNTDAIINRYLSGTGARDEEPNVVANTQNNLQHLQEFNKMYLEVSKELEAEKNKKEKIQEEKIAAANLRGSGFWFSDSLDGLGVEELSQYIASFDELIKKVLTRANELHMIQLSFSKTAATASATTADLFGTMSDDLEKNHPQNDIPFGTTPSNSIAPTGYGLQHGMEHETDEF